MSQTVCNGDQTSVVVPQSFADLSGTCGNNQLPVGTPARIAAYDQSGLAATQTGVTLSASLPTTGLYRISGYLKKTTAATTSSTLGPLTLTFTDGVDSTTLTVTLAFVTSAGAIATTNAVNVVTVTGLDNVLPFMFYGKIGTAVTFTLTYASSGTTAMVYEVHLHLEQI